jgi:crotonobetainyl-CoA:carnitine CoA-transferase CaiB-like acyl-CoA transferase
LIVCDISGYGSTGPYRDKKAYDLLIQCETGVVSVTGTPESPCKVGISIADIAGGMYAYSGILTALYLRERTGRGTRLEVSLFDALAEWMSQPAYFTAYGGSSPSRTGSSHASIAPYGPFATRDGGLVNIGIQNEREWEQFCRIVLQEPGLAEDERFASNSRRVTHRVELHGAIEEVLDSLSVVELLARLEAANVAYARMNAVEDFLRHPQLVQRDRWCDVDSPVGALRTLHPPVTSADIRPRMERIPSVGENTSSILHSLGYDHEWIADLQRQAAISCGT